MMRLVVLLSVVLMLHSCSSEQRNNENVFIVDYKEDTEFDWNSVLQVEDVIPLETNDSCLLGYASKCILCGDRIVYNDSKQKALYVFDNKGKFIYHIDALGTGDREYSMIKDVIISRDKRNILILDNVSILVFDLATGNYCDRISLDRQLASSFYQFADGGNGSFYFWSIEPENSLYVWNDGDLSPIKKRDGFPFVCQKFYYDAFGDLNLISDCGKYSIETVKGDSVRLKYSFDFGRWAFPSDKKVRTVTEWEKIDEQPCFKSLLSAFETKDILYLTTATPERNLYCVAVQKQTSKVFCGNQNVDAPVVVIGSDGTSFYGLLYPSLFVKDNAISDLIEKCDVSEEGNPLIVKFKFNFEISEE